MDVTRLDALVDGELEVARGASSGRHATTLMGDRDSDLRQTVIALAQGHRLGDHESPGEATLLVLRGAVRVVALDSAVDLDRGDYLRIPRERHGLEALSDCAVLLTVATRGERVP